MLEERNLKIDLLALGLLATVVFLAAALLSYDPADPPSHLVYPPHASPVNVCGYWGAIASRLLFEAIGLGAYYLVISLALFDAVLLTRREVSQPWIRTAGWLLSLVGVTTLAAMAVPSLSPGPVIGAGGYLGVTVRTLLYSHFASIGAFIFTVSMIVGGLLLCTDYVLIRVLAWAVGKPTRSLGRGMLQVGTAYAQILNRRRTDLDDFSDEIEEVTVRMNGRTERAAKVEEVEVEEEVEADEAHEIEIKAPVKEEETAESDDVVEEVEEKPKLSIRKTLAARVGLGRRKKPQDEESLEELNETDVATKPGDYQLPSLDLLLEGETVRFDEQEKEVRRKAKILEKTFLDFGFHVRVVEIQTGPVIAQFEVELEAGLRLSRITGLADDLAIALRVPSVRIVAPLPGKNTVGIEVPNSERTIVRLREVMEEANGKALKMRIPIYLGKDVAGRPLTIDLSLMPHLLIAGRTGTGKSVCLNSIIVSMIMTRRPDEVRMLMIDPKMVELSSYKSLPHLMHPVVTDMRKAEAILGWAVEKMEERYHLLARAGVRHISAYNQLGEDELMERLQPEDEEEAKQIPTHMPYIVIVADELADLMMTAAKEVESHIIRLAQKSRAVGIHLVLATQKPTVDVITGLIKSNLPARIAFQVASRTDSRVVLDEMGADKLLGDGDMLFLSPATSTLLRGQGTYLCDEEITRVIGAVATSEPEFVKELVQLKTQTADGDGKAGKISNRDELYESAVDIVIREGRGSVSLLQRNLGIGYGRAARLIDFMAEDGIVGPYNGSQAREVVVTLDQWAEMSGGGQAASPAPVSQPKPKRSNRIRLDAEEDHVVSANESTGSKKRVTEESDEEEGAPPRRRVSAEELNDEEANLDDEGEDDASEDVVDEEEEEFEDGEGEDKCVDEDSEEYFDDDDQVDMADEPEREDADGKRGGRRAERSRSKPKSQKTQQPKLPSPNSRWKAESA